MADETNYEKAKFFKSKKIAVHITKAPRRYSHLNKFYNGIILDVRAEVLILKDEVLGELPVFFSEIIEIEPREPKEEKECELKKSV